MLLKDAKFASFEGGAVRKHLCAYCSSAQDIYQVTMECGEEAFGCFDRRGRQGRENHLLSRPLILHLQHPPCCVLPLLLCLFGFGLGFGLFEFSRQGLM